MAKLEVSLSLDQRHLEWLQTMADKYSLPTADKALRIVIVYAKQAKDSQDVIFKKANLPIASNEVTGKHAIDKVHDDYLEEVAANYKLGSKHKALQIILDYSMSHVDEKTLFQVKRCRHGDTCKNC